MGSRTFKVGADPPLFRPFKDSAFQTERGPMMLSYRDSRERWTKRLEPEARLSGREFDVIGFFVTFVPILCPKFPQIGPGHMSI